MSTCETPSTNLEPFVCIWLDQLVYSDSNQEAMEKLRLIINFLKTFDNEQDCEKYIRDIQTEQIVLIVSGALGQTLVPRIHDLPQLAACYVFCRHRKVHKQWADQYYKVKSVVNKTDDLISQISQDQAIRNKLEESNSISVIIKDSTTLKERNAYYMWFQLYIEVLLRMHHKSSDRQCMIDLCKNLYRDNRAEMSIIHQFEKEYKSEDAILWYTRESCFYRIMNKALRGQDFDRIFDFRFFIADIAKHIKTEYEKFIRTTKTREPFCLYRGQRISNDDLELMRKSIGEFLSMNSFLSTSQSRSVALTFIEKVTHADGYHRILFEIKIDPEQKTKEFANIKESSFFKKEDEVLIMLGALFRIDKVFEDPQTKIWMANLTLADDDDFYLRETFAHMKSKISEETDLASLGKILFQMGKYDQVERCYEHMMRSAQLDVSAAHSGLSKAALGKNKFEEALNQERHALKIKKLHLPENHTDLGVSYSRLGNVYSKMNNSKYAVYYLEKAMRIEENSLPADSLILGKTYHRIATLYNQIGDYSSALEYCQKTLDIRLSKLPPSSPAIASTYNCIGDVYRSKENYSEALKYYKQALEIYKKTLLPDHDNVIKAQKNVCDMSDKCKK